MQLALSFVLDSQVPTEKAALVGAAVKAVRCSLLGQVITRENSVSTEAHAFDMLPVYSCAGMFHG